jgi:hypothetical protein
MMRTLGLLAWLTACTASEQSPPPVPPTPPRPLAWAFDAPESWGDRVRLDDDTAPGAALSARRFHYLPVDSTQSPQLLLGIVVYDARDWARLRAAEGPPPGDSLTAANGQVFAAGLPQSNPFVVSSADARAFDSLTVSLAQVRQAFRVLP